MTNYTHDWMKHLVGVSMVRGSVTQPRTFVYDDLGHLTSATNPETGTVAYYYNADNTLWYGSSEESAKSIRSKFESLLQNGFLRPLPTD